MKKAREEISLRLRFWYDTEERLTSLLNENREVYRFGYDNRGKIIEERGFDGLTRRYHRDRAGKVVRVERPGNRWTQYEYDGAGRLSRAEYSDDSWEVYSYNKNGQLLEAVNANSRVSFQRDAAGRIIEEEQDGYTVESRYNALGQRIKMGSNLGASINVERNEGGMVSGLQAENKAGTSWQAQYRYNALGMETERLLPGGIVSSFGYDGAGHPIEQKVSSASRIVRHRSYSWNVNDRLRSMVDCMGRGMVQYGHDDFGNLAWAKYEDGSFDYRLPDKVGNLFRAEDRKDRKYGPGGRLLESKGTRYSYDEEGNLIKKVTAEGQQWQYAWAGNGMLSKVARPDGKELSFEYDALGRRTAKVYDGMVTRWVWDGNTPLHEWKYAVKERPVAVVDEYGSISKDREEPVKGLIIWIFDEGAFKPAAKLQDGSIQSIITDYLGTPVEMYDTSGEKTWKAEYDIYGKIGKLPVGKAADCPFRYQGQYEDDETGLYYNRFRYYAPEEGMYLSQDPIKLEGGNPTLYGYVPDVNSWVDPFGLTIQQVLVIVCHYKSREGFNKIAAGKNLFFKAFMPVKGHPKGVYLTTKSPEVLSQTRNGFKKLGLTS